MLFLGSCGGNYEAPHKSLVGDINSQMTQPADHISRIDCELEMQVVDGKIIRLSNTSSIFEMNEDAGSDWPASTVVIPISQYSVMARYSKVSLNPKITGPAFYVVLCQGSLNLDSECRQELVIKVSERTGTLTSTVINAIEADIQFQYNQYSINQVRAVCTLIIQPKN